MDEPRAAQVHAELVLRDRDLMVQPYFVQAPEATERLADAIADRVRARSGGGR